MMDECCQQQTAGVVRMLVTYSYAGQLFQFPFFSSGASSFRQRLPLWTQQVIYAATSCIACRFDRFGGMRGGKEGRGKTDPWLIL